MRQLNLVILDEEIKNGARANCQACPLALALDRHLRPLYGAYVKSAWALIATLDNLAVRPGLAYIGLIEMPFKAQIFICRFDSLCSAKSLPRAHSFEIPDEVFEQCFYQVT